MAKDGNCKKETFLYICYYVEYRMNKFYVYLPKTIDIMETKGKLRINKINIVIDCSNAGTLAEFYSKLLGWEWTHPRANGWAAITAPTGMVFAFQEDENYQPPVWPTQSGKQGQMVHLDFYVDNLEEAVQYAIELGAKPAEEQFFRTSRTMIDPEGHTFCLDTDEPE